MGFLVEAAKKLNIDLGRMALIRGGLKPVNIRTFELGENSGRIALGAGRFRITNNPNAHRVGGGESGSQGNGRRVDGN